MFLLPPNSWCQYPVLLLAVAFVCFFTNQLFVGVATVELDGNLGDLGSMFHVPKWPVKVVTKRVAVRASGSQCFLGNQGLHP